MIFYNAIQVMHLDIDSFFVSVERLQNKRFVGVPLIIGGLSERGVVASCSYEARTYGVSSAMPIKQALRLCPHAHVVRGDMDVYSKFSNDVTVILRDRAPLVEKASIDEYYLDLTGMDRFFGCVKWAHELRQTIIKETGLPISFGLSVNKTVAKIATGVAKPNGEMNVKQEEVQGFLDPLSVKRIPGIGLKTQHILYDMGITRIFELKQISADMLHHVFGINGISLWQKANGIDNNPVVPYTEKKSISTEQTFTQDTTDIDLLNSLLVKMTGDIAFRLRRDQKMCNTVVLKLRYANFDTHTHQKRICYTASDDILLAAVKELFEKLYNRRILIRLVGIKVSGLINGTPQLSLFDNNRDELLHLYQAMDNIRIKFGSDKIKRAINIGKPIMGK